MSRNVPIPSDEKELLLKLREGDERAFEQVYNLYSSPVFGSILKLLKDRDTSEDILQDVFIKVWQSRMEIDPDRSFKSYLFVIAKNKVYNYMRRATLEVQVSAYLAARSAEGYNPVEADMQYAESSEAIRKAIDALPPKRKEVFIFCKIEGHSYQEAAEKLGCSVAAINAHIVKATKSIKTQLKLTNPVMVAVICSAFDLQM
ncbi:RNA polymerase sigma factor [Sphingobacterium humi]|uniref:RNA polymerase sigma factor n=1 Tax=Sphingobacterium humi TaxID=1796905 RepID=A0A6N8L6F0_9SPHI|nr:RNA polymerase sigma-70 factor [Sphingobacterium humi]MVZ63758.1 RNA polymerase sigma-70 factor [Sphingobacterium humi]